MFAIYLLAHLTPSLVLIGKKFALSGNPMGKLLEFMSELFNLLLPALHFFKVSDVLLSDSPISTGEYFLYVGSVAFYGVMYTMIILLLRLILFEDRDLA